VAEAAQSAGTALVLFDLDGTLADTFPDLEHALGRALAEHGMAPGERAGLRAAVSAGSRAMVEVALAGRQADAAALQARFLAHYRCAIAERTRLFEGMAPVLDALAAHGVGAGVVTNKLAAFTEPLIAALGLSARLRCVVSGDSAPRPKPHPDPLHLAARRAGVAHTRCVYVGDARNDVLAARAAGMPVAVAAWGYLPSGEDPSGWRADRLLSHPRELLHWLGLAA
jgi:phosphoglycolate phosphatase